MKYLLIIFCILFSGSLWAQENNEISIYSSILAPGELFYFGNKTLEFKEVVSDSRCPKDVTCIQAGEAKILVAIYENNEFIGEKILSTVLTSIPLPFFTGEDAYSIPALELLPYPSVKKPITKQEYSLRLQVKVTSQI